MKNGWRRVVLGVLLAGVAAACANPAADQALYAQNALVGMPKQTLLSCAGVPERQATVNNLEYFTYHSGRLVSYPAWGGYGGYGGYWGPRRYGYGGGFGWPAYSADVASIDCEATFTLRNGVVERIVYGGASGGATRLGQCYAIVQNCIAMVPQQTPPAPRAPAQ